MADKNKKLDKQVEQHHLSLIQELRQTRESAFTKFPLLFSLLGTFGLVSIFYSFNKILEKIPLMANNPIITLIIGVLMLVFTGKLYKKLG